MSARKSSIVFAAVLVSLFCHVSAFAQFCPGTCCIIYRIDINGALGAVVSVTDNQAGQDGNPAPTILSVPFAANNGQGVSITGTIIGENIPEVAPLIGRRLRIDNVLAQVAPGVMSFANNDIDLYACYTFDQVPVPAPNTWRTAMQGIFTNVDANPANGIDLAQIDFLTERNGCRAFGDPGGPPGGLGASTTIFNQPEPVPFFEQFIDPAWGQVPVSVIGSYTRFTVWRDGDAVAVNLNPPLPIVAAGQNWEAADPSEGLIAEAVQAQIVGMPASSPLGLILLASTLLALATIVIWRRRISLRPRV